jgi:uracil-DNA glycosylase
MGHGIPDGLLGEGWDEVLAPQAGRLAELGGWLRAELEAGRRFGPPGRQVLAALAMPFADVRVLLVGQDPYPTPGHAIGLAFAAAPGVRPLPRSLDNVLAEYAADLGLPRPDDGDLTPWVEQGVLLLNRVLTVELGRPGSHRGRGWEQVTDAIVDALVARGGALVAILWGNDARALGPRLGSVPRIESVHPSPLSAARGFLGSRPFSRANAALAAQGAAPVDWRLPVVDPVPGGPEAGRPRPR